jgi:DNA-binding transcriptional MerR regulator
MFNNIQGEVDKLRGEGLADSQIIDELTKKGFTAEQVSSALNSGSPEMPEVSLSNGFSSHSSTGNDDVYERIEEITENMIDEKWDELITEVKKIVEWKESVHEKQLKIQHDLDKLKEDFNVLHQGVLGKLEDYDTRMRDVGTELNAVGKVFKDVIPEFVDNVKEFSRMTGRTSKEEKKEE